jgi:hypothetical protein
MPNWWLVSWTTYATWLPGDERGYCTWRGKKYVPPPKRYAKPGEPTYKASDHTAVRELAKAISKKPVYFSPEEMQVALNAIVSEIAEIEVTPAIISLGQWLVHWLCHFGTLNIRTIVGRVKAAATRELNACGFKGKRPWTKGCNMRSKATRIECRNAYKYVRDHWQQGCLIHEWKIDPKNLKFE